MSGDLGAIVPGLAEPEFLSEYEVATIQGQLMETILAMEKRRFGNLTQILRIILKAFFF